MAAAEDDGQTAGRPHGGDDGGESGLAGLHVGAGVDVAEVEQVDAASGRRP